MARIIIADDDMLTVEIVRSALEKRGHIVGALPDGRSVCSVVETKRPDLLILDCMMPGISGVDALRQVRTSAGGFDTPILMLTGRTSLKDEGIAWDAGADDYLRKPFEPDQLDNSVSIIRPSTDSRSLGLEVEIDEALAEVYVGDEDRIRQVILNLLNNAVKFTHQGSVGLSVALAGNDDGADLLEFAVTDTGIGIPESAQKRLFRPFNQSDSSIWRKYGGSGLGLTICKRLVEAMGGEIGLSSSAGNGSRFWFKIPLAHGAMDDQPGWSGTVPSGQADILLVEDLPLNRELATTMLERAGHRVTLASDGAEAVEAASGTVFDIILMDIQMPRMDGIEATRKIRALPGANGKVPIVAMTANVMPDQVARYRAAGMDGHVAKPIRQPELHGEIARLAPAIETAAKAGISPTAPPADIFDSTRFETVGRLLPADRLADHVSSLDLQLGQLCDSGPGEPEASAAAAHKVASQAGMLGLVRLENRARAYELAFDEGDVARRFEELLEAGDDVQTYAVPAARCIGDDSVSRY